MISNMKRQRLDQLLLNLSHERKAGKAKIQTSGLYEIEQNVFLRIKKQKDCHD